MSKFCKMTIQFGNTEKGIISENIFDHINTTIDRISDCVTIDDIKARYDIFFGETTKDLFSASDVADADIIPNVCDPFKYNPKKHRVGMDDGTKYAFNPMSGNRIGRYDTNTAKWYKCDSDGNWKFKRANFQKLFYVIADPAFNTRARYDAAQERAEKLNSDFVEHLTCKPVKNSGATEVSVN